MEKSEINSPEIRDITTQNVSTNFDTTHFKTLNADLSDDQLAMGATPNQSVLPQQLGFLKQAMGGIQSQATGQYFRNQKQSAQTAYPDTNTWDDQSENKTSFQFNQNGEYIDLSQIQQQQDSMNNIIQEEQSLRPNPVKPYTHDQSQQYCKPIKISLKKLGDNKYQIIQEQKKKERQHKIENIFLNLSKTVNKSLLYKNLKSGNRQQIISQLDDKIEKHRKRAKQMIEEKQNQIQSYEEKAVKSHQRLEVYHQQLVRNQSLRELQLNQKLTKAEQTLQKIQKSKQDEYEQRQEMVQKRTLRAKIANILKNKSPILCQDYLQKQERVSIFNNKYKTYEEEKGKSQTAKGIIVRNPNTQEMIPRLVELKDENLNFETPDEVFVNYFTEEELQMIQDDPNYFITDIRYKDLITLFDHDTLDALLDNKDPDQLNKTFKEKYYEQFIHEKKLQTEQQKTQMMSKFRTSTKKYGQKNRSIGDTEIMKQQVIQHQDMLKNETLRIRYNFTQTSSPMKSQAQIHLALEKIKTRDEQHRAKMEKRLKDKMRDAEAKKAREQLKAINKVLDQRDKQLVKYSRIQENRQRLHEDQELMKNFYAKIEENCMQAQVQEIQNVMKDTKLQPVRNHLEKWKIKVGVRNSKSIGEMQQMNGNYSQYIKEINITGDGDEDESAQKDNVGDGRYNNPFRKQQY